MLGKGDGGLWDAVDLAVRANTGRDYAELEARLRAREKMEREQRRARRKTITQVILIMAAIAAFLVYAAKH
jgi:hypothetical protein